MSVTSAPIHLLKEEIMVRKHEKYKWAGRKSHFMLLALNKSIVFSMQRQCDRLSKEGGLFSRLGGEFAVPLSVQPQWPADVRTRSEREPGTTIPDAIFMKLEVSDE